MSSNNLLCCLSRSIGAQSIASQLPNASNGAPDCAILKRSAVFSRVANMVAL